MIACGMTASTFNFRIAQAVLKHACLASREVLGVNEEVRTHYKDHQFSLFIFGFVKHHHILTKMHLFPFTLPASYGFPLLCLPPMAFTSITSTAQLERLLQGHAVLPALSHPLSYNCFTSHKKALVLAFSARTLFRRSLVCAPTSVLKSPVPSHKPHLAMTKPLPRITSPFGDFFVERFSQNHPKIAPTIRPDQTALAANAYLFRFDERLSRDFVHSSIDNVTRLIAEASGKSLEEARHLFTTNARDAARSYFATGWGDVTHYINANTPSLLALRRLNSQHVAICDFLHKQTPGAEVDPIMLDALRDTDLLIIVFVFAKYCSSCKAARPLFDKAAADSDGDVVFVSLNGPKYPEARNELDVSAFPAILRITSNGHIVHFPPNREMTVKSIASFAKSPVRSPVDAKLHIETDNLNDHKPMDSLLLGDILRKNPENWDMLLKSRGIDELEVLANERNVVINRKIAQAIKCEDTSCHIPLRRDYNNGEPLPMCMLLGGGMGAGKTTIVDLISKTEFWRQYGDDVVVVEADAFKHDDPLFQVLQGVTPLASRIVHKDSIIAAEELFLKAVNGRRDVVFDGTLSWCEYARQTVEMLRDTEYYYERGPGYLEKEDGTTEEVYWVRGERRKTAAVPYRVELVGVTAEADVSIMRGIVRRITTGRGVAVSDQLSSHALFSQNFDQYLNMVDSAYLFDTTLPSIEGTDKKDYTMQLVGFKPGILFKTPQGLSPTEGEFFIRFHDAYSRFLKKGDLNTDASCCNELYCKSVVAR